MQLSLHRIGQAQRASLCLAQRAWVGYELAGRYHAALCLTLFLQQRQLRR